MAKNGASRRVKVNTDEITFGVEIECALPQHFIQAHGIEIGSYRRGEGNHLGNLGNAYAALGQVAADKNHPSAIGYYKQALALAREIGDRRGEGTWCWNLGLLYKETDPARAAALMQVCVDYEREIGHPDAGADAAWVRDLLAAAGDATV